MNSNQTSRDITLTAPIALIFHIGAATGGLTAITLHQPIQIVWLAVILLGFVPALVVAARLRHSLIVLARSPKPVLRVLALLGIGIAAPPAAVLTLVGAAPHMLEHLFQPMAIAWTLTGVSLFFLKVSDKSNS